LKVAEEISALVDSRPGFPAQRDNGPTERAGGLKRVCYVTMQFPAPSETFATNDVRWLRQRGLAVSVHGLRGAHPKMATLLQERRLAGLDLTHNSVMSSVRGIAYGLTAPLRLLRTVGWLVSVNRGRWRQLLRSLVLLPRAYDILASIRREKPDVVHVYWAHYPAMVGHLVQTYLPNLVTSISFVAYDLEMEYGGSASVAQRADVVRTLAFANIDHVASAFGVDAQSVQVVYDGIDVERIDAAANGCSKVPGRMVTVGRLTEAKGMYEVLEVFASVVRRAPHARLRVLGDGPEASRLRRRARELGISAAVDFLGHVSQERVMEELAQAQILLLLTKASGERLPNVVKEGMASRCVCVTTTSHGVSELLANGVHGFIVPPGEVEEPARIVGRILTGELDVSALVEEAHRHVRANFDLNKSCIRYLEHWRRALLRRRAATLVESGEELMAS
jgi:colanic acid/amylovoran biosynthesis glycosyltransferase